MKNLVFILLLIQSLNMSAQENDPWTQYMTPSDFHGLLSNYEGEFKMEMKMVGSKDPILVNSSHKMILGGRFLEMRQMGNMMGMDFESILTLGYNTIDHSVSMTTITNMGTGTLSLQGKWDAETRMATLYGKLTNPVSKNTILVKQTISLLDDDTLLIESFDKEGDVPERKTVQYKFVRLP